MAKGYWMTTYREILDADKLAAYAALAATAVQANGGRFLVRGGRMQPKEAAVAERTVLVEFDSYEQALATYEELPAYQEALKALEGGVVRDLRIVEGID
ncbi:MAG: hypothetical protein CL395_01965 [Acidiferrobacteraceae bacterium]|jgi:uncharacterized protein (DUF1330 family)|nr:hypothetical protein [Acidiferrobacteraceae bacterium]MCP4829689.1 DUF1330 domain-containing protein [Pseudomonadota bacterium]HJP08182.1 DUF1330 domain-containing protein [Arenicellales bacterium]|tara:strand:+ start:212 stop:508 length:297 start_codon:yes stop_codon:yes gene_type:complete